MAGANAGSKKSGSIAAKGLIVSLASGTIGAGWIGSKGLGPASGRTGTIGVGIIPGIWAASSC